MRYLKKVEPSDTGRIKLSVDSLRERVEKAFHEPQYQKVKRDLEYFLYSNAWCLVEHSLNRGLHPHPINVDYDGIAHIVYELFEEQHLASLNTKTEDILQASLYKEFVSHLDPEAYEGSLGDAWTRVNGEGFREFFHRLIDHFFEAEKEFYIDMILTCSCIKSYDGFFSKHRERLKEAQKVKLYMENDSNGEPHDNSHDRHLFGSKGYSMPEFNVRVGDDKRLYADVCVMNEHGIHARPTTDIIGLRNHYDIQTSFILNGREIGVETSLGILALGLEPGTHLTLAVNADNPQKGKEYLKGLYDIFAKTLAEYDAAKKVS